MLGRRQRQGLWLFDSLYQAVFTCDSCVVPPGNPFQD